MILGFFLLLLVSIVMLHTRGRHWSHLPSLPGYLPLIGDAATIGKGKYLSRTLAGFARQVGPVFKLRLLHKVLVVLSGELEIKSAHSLPALDARPGNPVINLLFCGSEQPKGITFNFGSEWQELRRFTMRALKDFGFGKASMEERILEESSRIEANFRDSAEKSAEVDISSVFDKATLNVVWGVVAGKTFLYDDVEIERLLGSLDDFLKFGSQLQKGPLILLPWLRHLPPWRSNFEETREGMDKVRCFLRDIINSHEETLDPSEVRDVIDALLVESQKSDRCNGAFAKENLLVCSLDLFTGGTETTSKTLQNLIALMALHPDLQKIVHQELVAAAPNRQVCLADQSIAPMTMAVITEAWRLWPIIPIAPPRFAREKVSFAGRVIPAGTGLMSNIYAAHTDPEVWDEPLKFRPERHLTDGEYINKDRLLTFGTGRRRCIGEVLARAETFLLFANVVKVFEVVQVPGRPPCLAGADGLTLGPQPYNVQVFQRKVNV